MQQMIAPIYGIIDITLSKRRTTPAGVGMPGTGVMCSGRDKCAGNQLQ